MRSPIQHQSLLLIMVAALGAPAPAQELPHEHRNDRPIREEVKRTSPQRAIQPPEYSAPFAPIQINVGDDGDNILDDAANEPSLAVDPTAPNRIAVGWRQFDSVLSDHRTAGYAWTNDGGRTWHFPGSLTPAWRSDPVLRADNDGTMYYYTLLQTLRCQLWVSDDAGQTWNSRSPIYGGDKAWICVDRSGGQGEGNLYASWTHNGCCGDNWFSRAEDGGSFEEPVPINGRPVFGTSTVGPDGAVFVSGKLQGFDNDAFFILSRSDNAQVHGETPTFEFSEVPLGGTYVRLLDFSPNPAGGLGQVNVVVDTSGGPYHGAVYFLCSIDPAGDDPLDILLCRSDDGGKTWIPPVKIHPEEPGTNAWQWFGTLSIAPNGRLDAVWNDTLTDDYLTSETRYACSNDGGQTWSEPESLGPAWNSHIGWPNDYKIGDYYDMESDLVGASLVYATTYNGEQDIYFHRIGDYDCNGNGIGDATDVATGSSADCNQNGIPDECEIAAGAASDANGDGWIDTCCPADFNGDGAVDTRDVLAFLNAWGAGDTSADCDENGVIDTRDVLCFLNLWNSGC